VCQVKCPTEQITCHFGDKSFQAVDCTGTDQLKARKQNTTYTPNTKEKQKKTALANRTIYTLIWYALYDLQPGN